jgi:hypothetical protein
MTFLNFALLAGAGALAIPVVIHLFHRSRFRVVEWGAMHLLEQVLRTNRRRVRIEQILLMLLRALIPVLLALLMARPVLTGRGILSGGAPSSVILVLDDSYSMQGRTPAGTTWQRAVEAASGILDGLPRGSDAAVVFMGGKARALSPQPAFDLRRLGESLRAAGAAYGAADVPGAFEVAAGLLGRMHHADREVIFISDFQASSWSGGPADAAAALRARLAAAGAPARVTLFRVGEEVRDNLSVESLDYPDLMTGVGEKVSFRANLKNHGDAEHPRARVYFLIDGRERGASEVSLPARGQAQVLFTHLFETAGSHHVEVRVEGDALDADNRMLASIPVWDRLPVLVVDGDRAGGGIDSESAFLALALQPFAAGKMPLADLVDARVVEPRELDAAALRDVRAVVLANVRRLEDSQVRELERFVHRGGGLLVFPGNRIEGAWYQSALFARGNGLLPAGLETLAGDPAGGREPSAIVSERFAHPALAFFNDAGNGSLGEGRLRLWFRLSPATEGGRERPAATVLARLDSGDPFLVERAWGAGRVILSAGPADADWGNLPMRPFYVPLMQRLVTYLGSAVVPPRNLEVGRPLVALSALTTPAGGNDGSKPARLVRPDATSADLAPARKGEEAVYETGDTWLPGLYALDVPGSGTVHYVFNTPRDESALALLDAPAFRALAQKLGASPVSDLAGFRELDSLRRHGREIWHPLLWVLLAVAFGEQLLARRIGGRRAAA